MKLNITKQQLTSLIAITDDISSMIGCGDEDQHWKRHVKLIDRIVELYSNPNEVVLTPFAGVGSEVYSPVSMGRKAIGIELKDSYYKQMLKHLKEVKSRYKKNIKTENLF